jgi:phospholipase/carboxylesterase
VFIAHGRADPVIGVQFGQQARALLQGGGLEVEYHEGGGGHEIEAAHLRAAISWLPRVV